MRAGAFGRPRETALPALRGRRFRSFANGNEQLHRMALPPAVAPAEIF